MEEGWATPPAGTPGVTHGAKLPAALDSPPMSGLVDRHTLVLFKPLTCQVSLLW